MTHNRTWLRVFIFLSVFIFVAGAALDAYSRGGRGGGRGGGGGHRMSGGGHRGSGGNRNISRSGPARSGSMRSSDFSRGSRSSGQMSRSGRQSGSTRPAGGVDRSQARQKAQDYKAANPDAGKNIKDRVDNRPGDRQENRQDWKDQNREDWQQYGRNARDDRQDYYEHHDYHEHYEYHDDWEWGENVEYPYAAATAIALGTALTVSAFNSLTCTPTVVTIGAVTYYQCGPNWYNQAYQNGDVVYMSVATPPGY